MKLAIKLQNLIESDTGFCIQYRPDHNLFNMNINGHYFHVNSKEELLEVLELFEKEDEEELDL